MSEPVLRRPCWRSRCSPRPAPSAAAQPSSRAYDLLINGGTIYDGSGGAPLCRRRRDQGRPDRLCGPTAPGDGHERCRCQRARGRAGLHQHAQLGDGILARRSARGRATSARASPSKSWAKAGRWDPLNDEMKKLAVAAAGRRQISDRMDDARRISELAGAQRHRRSTSLPSSARRPSASTSLAKATSIPTRRSSTGCAAWSARRWRKARSASAVR